MSSWFAGKDLALALGLNISISRLGSVANDIVEPLMSNATGSPNLGLWVGAVICVFSLICGLLLIKVDNKRDRKLGLQGKKKLDPSGQVRFRDIGSFGVKYWLITLNCIVIYMCVMSFNNVATNFFQERFGLSKTDSGYAITPTYIIAALICPVFGKVVDGCGKRPLFIIFAAVCVTMVHVIFILLPDCDGCYYGVAPLVLLGIGYSVYASVMWSCIPYVVPKKAVGTAFGVTTAFQNMGLGAAPLAIGWLKDGTSPQDGYFFVSLFLVGMGILGILSAILLFVADITGNKVLSSSDPRSILKALNPEGDSSLILPEESPEATK